MAEHSLDTLLAALRAGGDATRVRLLALFGQAELTVSELTRILGQSQPRISRHLRTLADASLVDRHQEGAWAFYRLADQEPGAGTARTLVALLPDDDPVLAEDRRRLEAVRRTRAKAAADYFRRSASQWDRIRTLYVGEGEVEQAMLEAAGQTPIDELLDLGTGTGRVLQVFGDRIQRGVGIDLSRDMLAVARANLEARDLRHCQVRHGDIYRLAVPAGSVDVAVVHHVLHFLDEPAAVIAEGARALRPGGRLIIVDFAPHAMEFLRTEHAHRRLGFRDEEITAWCAAAGLGDTTVRHLGAGGASPERLTVSIWCSLQRGHVPAHHRLEVA